MTKSKKGKSKTASQPNSAKSEPDPDRKTSSPPAPPGISSTSLPMQTEPGGPPANSPSGFPPSIHAFQAMPPGSSTDDWMKVQTLDDTLKIFLQPNIGKDDVTSLKLYRILVHFNPKTSSRPGNLKALLWDAYLKEVYPLLKPHLAPEPPAPMESQSSTIDFNPLHRKTTQQHLITAVHLIVPKFVIPSASPRDRLLVLYKAFVDRDLHLPWLTDFIEAPNVVGRDRISQLNMEELRMTLQQQAPHVFIHLSSMSLPVLINLYIKFVIEEPVADDVLVKGFHYSLFEQAESS